LCFIGIIEKPSTIFLVKSKSGRCISSISKFSENQEIVFLPKTKFTVTNYYKFSRTVFGQKNIRESAYKATERDIEKFIDKKNSPYY